MARINNLNHWRLEKINQISSGKEVELQQSKNLLHRNAQFCFEIKVSTEEIHAQGDPYLGQDGIAGRAQERFNLQILLDPLEEELNRSTLFVNVCDLLDFQEVGIGDKTILDTGFRIGVCDQAERRFNAFEPDVLVTEYPDKKGSLEIPPERMLLNSGEGGRELRVMVISIAGSIENNKAMVNEVNGLLLLKTDHAHMRTDQDN